MLKLKKIRSAARELRLSSVTQRNQVLKKASELLLQNSEMILKANLKDLNKLAADSPAAFRDRLMLDKKRISHMAESLRQVAALPDPLVQKKTETRKLKNGLVLKKIRSPLGVIFMIFESRPNVAIEAFSMGFKSANAMILRGGKESRQTTAILYRILQKAVVDCGFSQDVIWGITDPDRQLVSHLLLQKQYIDVVVPRGGDRLIEFVVENSLIPIIKNDRGLCHVYVHSDADLQMALKIIVNAKTQRPGVCNSMETMLIHRQIAEKLLPLIQTAMRPFDVLWYGCEKTCRILKDIKKAKEVNWQTEYLEQIVNCRVVDGINQAIEHIEAYGSRHSEAIVTRSLKNAEKFQKEVDAAVVYWNASTRFTDGFEFGLGGELGISTQKLHVRGPVGLEALTNQRWLVKGQGQTR